MSTSSPLNGHDETEKDLTSLSVSLPHCLLNELPAQVHEYIHQLENRVQIVEAKQKRFEEALVKMGKFIFESPQGKMILMAFPKEMQNGLKDYFNGV